MIMSRWPSTSVVVTKRAILGRRSQAVSSLLWMNLCFYPLYVELNLGSGYKGVCQNNSLSCALGLYGFL